MLPSGAKAGQWALYGGLLAGIIIALASFGGGAIRYRGGVLRALNLDFLAYGHGAAISNISLWVGTILLLISWVFLGRYVIIETRLGTACETILKQVQKSIWFWILPLSLAAPILSRDVYSYLMQGAMTRDGFDPYIEGAAVNPGPMLLEVSHDWRNTTTPYGPLHLWLGEGITRLVGDNITAGVLLYKLVAITGFAGIAWAIPRLATYFTTNPAYALWLGVANPLMILHLIGGMHNESLMVGLVCIGLVLTLKNKYFAGVALISVAVSLKATAAIALPFVVWIALHKLIQKFGLTGWKQWVIWAAAGFITVAEMLGILAIITWASGTSWGWLAEITGNSKVINPLALPTLIAGLISDTVLIINPQFEYNPLLENLRLAGSFAMLAGLILVWWFFRSTEKQAIQGIAIAYAVAFSLNSVTLPWYYASLIPLIAVTPVPHAIKYWSTGISLFIALSFTGSGNHQLYNTAWMLGAAALAWTLTHYIYFASAAKPAISRTSSPAPDAEPPVLNAHAAHQ
ncbi:alpha-(1-_6)-mannopyranosyltransferase A [Corynebacterium caspium]|uniref:alpha-(1->6)-mannopyranosyltransferase A n=1 Tax=Corynebacterium caspium TaxID=234828 RepID=UPI000685EB1A